MRIGHHIRTALARARAFLCNRDANVAMIFEIAIIPVTIAAGAGLVLTRAMIVKTSLSEALDAAALAVGGTSGLSQSQMQTVAQNYFNANYKADTSYGTPAAVSLTPNGQSVTVTSSVPMPTTLMGLAGIHTVTVSSASTVVWGQTKLWVGLVLDNTGSMCQTDTNPNANAVRAPAGVGHQDRVAARPRRTTLLTMLQNAAANPGDVQVAIVPFVQDVNVGSQQCRLELDRLERLGSRERPHGDISSIHRAQSTVVDLLSTHGTTGRPNGRRTLHDSLQPDVAVVAPATTAPGPRGGNISTAATPASTCISTWTTTVDYGNTTTKQTCTQKGRHDHLPTIKAAIPRPHMVDLEHFWHARPGLHRRQTGHQHVEPVLQSLGVHHAIDLHGCDATMANDDHQHLRSRPAMCHTDWVVNSLRAGHIMDEPTTTR